MSDGFNQTKNEDNEKYISVSLDAKWFLGHCIEALVSGKDKIYVNFFKNTGRKQEKEPVYSNRQGGLWIKKKNPERPKVLDEIEEIIMNNNNN